MSRLSSDDTIAAIASPPGPAIRGIVRISGPATEPCLTRLFQTARPLSEIKSACSLAAKIRLDSLQEIECQLLFWPNTQSYTRQVSAEIHTTGNRPLLEWTLEQLCRAKGEAVTKFFRAEPDEAGLFKGSCSCTSRYTDSRLSLSSEINLFLTFE